MVAPRVESTTAALPQRIIGTAELLCVHVLLVKRVIRIEKAVVVRMWLELGLFA